MQTDYNPNFDNISIRDIISGLEGHYELGVTLKRESIEDVARYQDGRYYHRGATFIALDIPLKRQPPINIRYQAWHQVGLAYLDYSIISKLYKAKFQDSKATYDLDNAMDAETTARAYDTSLRSLDGIIEALGVFRANSIKTISLLKLGSILYIHVEPDNKNVLLHEFKPGSPLEQEFEYIYSNQGRLVFSAELEIVGQGSNAKRNLSEDLRAMKVRGNLKKHFFPQSNADSILFNNHAELSDDELNILIAGLKSDNVTV
jgi:hypothetical protein